MVFITQTYIYSKFWSQKSFYWKNVLFLLLLFVLLQSKTIDNVFWHLLIRGKKYKIESTLLRLQYIYIIHDYANGGYTFRITKICAWAVSSYNIFCELIWFSQLVYFYWSKVCEPQI